MRLESNRAALVQPSGKGSGEPPRPRASSRWQPTLAAAAAFGALLPGCADAGLSGSAFDLAVEATGTAESAGAGVELGQATQPIIGGSPDEATSGVVGLALDLGTRVVGHCSGTLIAPNLVLTARHCVALTEDTDDEGIVQCDTAEFRNTFPARMLLASSDPVRPTSPDHPSYVRGREIRTLGDGKVCGFDIALIILEEVVAPAAVPIAPRLAAAPADRERFSTVGYGLTIVDDPNSDGTRQRAEGSAVRCSGEDCVSLSGGAIRSSEWASVDAPICSGDSGGPALDELGRVFGVASRGDPQCEIAVFGAVSSWAPFIIDTALDAADAGGYSPPEWALEGPQPTAEGAGGCSLAAVRAQTPARGWSLATMILCSSWMVRRKLGASRAVNPR